MIGKKIKKLLFTYQHGGMTAAIGVMLRWLLCYFRILFRPAIFYKIEMYLLLGYWPNFKNPQSLNEKIQCRQLFSPHPLSTIVADKWAVRDYIVSKTNRPDILNDIFFAGAEPEKIPFAELPKAFVIKATHGSGWNIIVHDKDAADRSKIVSTCRKWLNTKYSVASRNYSETHYDRITPRVIIEKYIEDSGHKVPLDYKFYCFGGKPIFVLVTTGRYANHRENYYDLNWNEMPFNWDCPIGEGIAKPNMLEEMIGLASQIAGDFDFCRVDFYCPNNKKIIFGEITLAPVGGLGRFYPRKWDYYFGGLWDFRRI
jgi:hypothetical protein